MGALPQSTSAPLRTGQPKRLLEEEVPWATLRPEEFRDVPCNICGSSDFTIRASLAINKIEFLLVECENCALIWRNPLPGETFISSLYTKDYYRAPSALRDHVGIADTEPTDKQFRDWISAQVVKSWVELGIESKGPSGESKKLLEIGGGGGHLQKAAAARGWDTLGLEISEHAVGEASKEGLNVLPLPLDTVCEENTQFRNHFDVIVFYDLLEHVDDPGRFLRMIRAMLADDGNIIFRVPETTRLPTLHLIDHTWHFSTAALRWLLRKEGLTAWHGHYSGPFISTNGNDYMNNMTIYARKSDAGKQSDFPEIILAQNPLGITYNSREQSRRTLCP